MVVLGAMKGEARGVRQGAQNRGCVSHSRRSCPTNESNETTGGVATPRQHSSQNVRMIPRSALTPGCPILADRHPFAAAADRSFVEHDARAAAVQEYAAFAMSYSGGFAACSQNPLRASSDVDEQPPNNNGGADELPRPSPPRPAAQPPPTSAPPAAHPASGGSSTEGKP